MSTHKRRMEIVGQSVGNLGFYVRSIVRKQLLEMDENTKPSHVDQRVEPVGQNSNALLRPLIQKNQIDANELDQNCLFALSRCPNPMADSALKAYAKQEQRREMKGTERISDPSSYVMAVLRYAINSLILVFT